MADRIELRFSLKYNAKRSENKSSWHLALSYHRFRDIPLQFTSLSLIVKNYFPCIFSMISTYTNGAFQFLTDIEKNYFKILIRVKLEKLDIWRSTYMKNNYEYQDYYI